MTFKPLTESRGEELLTSFLEGFHAKTLVQQEEAQELPESAAECGNTWQGLLAKYNPDTASWKTPQCSLFEDLEQSLKTFPRWGSMRNGELYQRQPWEHPISETVFGFFVPTPVSSDGTSGAVTGKNDTFYTTSTGMPRKINQNGKDGSVGRGHLVQMWPTPVAREGNGSHQFKLTDAVEATIGKAMPAMQKKPHLWQKFQSFPTPTAHNAKECNAPSEKNRNTPTLATFAAGKLNPDWVEWLMNWPIKWSDLNGFDTKEFERWQKASAKAIQGIGEMRAMWWDADPSQAPHGQQPTEQPKQQHSNSLSEMSWNASRERPLERSQQGSDLSLLRTDVCLQEAKRKDLQSGVWEQTCLDETQIVPRVGGTGIARVDRLKAIGNGQVPLCAATAWKVLK
jgi:hypothetical protein